MGHSNRIGGASTAAACGVALPTIARLGLWAEEVPDAYI